MGVIASTTLSQLLQDRQGSFSGRKGSLRFIPDSDMEALSSSNGGRGQILLSNVPPKTMGEVHSRQRVSSRKSSSTMGASDHAMSPRYPALTPNGSTMLWEALGHSPKQAPGPRGSKHLRGQLWLPRHCPTASYGGEPYSNATVFKTVSNTQDRPRDKSWANKVNPEALP